MLFDRSAGFEVDYELGGDPVRIACEAFADKVEEHRSTPIFADQQVVLTAYEKMQFTKLAEGTLSMFSDRIEFESPRGKLVFPFDKVVDLYHEKRKALFESRKDTRLILKAGERTVLFEGKKLINLPRYVVMYELLKRQARAGAQDGADKGDVDNAGANNDDANNGNVDNAGANKDVNILCKTVQEDGD